LGLLDWGLGFSLIALWVVFFAILDIPQARTQKPLPCTSEQWETRFVKP
jgi:hypothetical protein